MEDADLDAIRQRRMAELSGGSGGAKGDEEAAQRAAEEAESRRAIMGQILDPAARERLSRIALVRPERERSLQDLLVRMARSGQLRGRVTDDQLLGLLDQVAAAETANSNASKSKITFNRRQDKSTLSDDEEDEPTPSRTTGSSKAQAKPADDDDDDIFDL